MINKDKLEKIKSFIPITGVIGKRVKLNNYGNNRKIGLCPFHNEKTPSFTVNESEGFFHCFGCSTGGDVINFLQKINNISFMDAVKELAQIAGVTIETDDDKFTEEYKDKFYDVITAARDFYQTELFLPQNQTALAYLTQKRKLGMATIRKFNLGYSSNSLVNFLLSKGFSKKNIEDLKLAREKNNKMYDFFYNRLMIPIKNVAGKFIGFGGRLIDDSDGPKYLNSADSDIFKKGETLFNFFEAKKESIAAKKALIVVEGYMDVMILWQFGFPYAIAPLGTSVTNTQLKLIFSCCKEPIFCFNNDNAGKNAMLKAANMTFPFLTAGIVPRFAILKTYNDLDDLCKSYTSEIEAKIAINKLLTEALQLQDFIWTSFSIDVNFKNPNEVVVLEEKFNDVCSAIKDPSLKKNYQTFFRNKMFNASRSKVKQSNVPPPMVTDNKFLTLEISSLAILLLNPKIILQEDLQIDIFEVMSENGINIYNRLSGLVLSDSDICFKTETESIVIILERLADRKFIQQLIDSFCKFRILINERSKCDISILQRIYLEKNNIFYQLLKLDEEIKIISNLENKNLDIFIKQKKVLLAELATLDKKLDTAYNN